MVIFRCLILLFIISCTHLPTKQYPININNYKHNYLLQQYNTPLENNEPAIPEMIPLPVEFPDLTISNQFLSINVNEEVSVKDLLVEIGKLSDVNLDIDPKISGNIILKLKDKNINEVIQNIANSAKLRYSINNDVIRIEQDLPYAQNYYVDFINIQHSAQSNFVIGNNITDSDADRNYNNVTKSQYSSDLWNSLEKGLNAIMDVNGVDDGEFLSSNREAGVIILNARKDIHKAVEEYINKVKKLASSQVMIEAKIVEVILDDKYLSGINLNDLHNETKSMTNQGNSIIDLAINSDLGYLVKNLNKFGTSKVISSPRVHAINNQQAMISFTKNHIYFTSDIQKDTRNSLITKMNSTPIGVVLIIHPSINIDTNEIFMDIHPTLSRINDYTKDPNIEYVAQQNKMKLNSNIPIVETREMHSTLKVKSGEVMVIGGLIEHRKDTSSSLHQKSKKLANNSKTVETVIFLKATIVPTLGLLDIKDRNLYIY
ncbi:MAG: secretion system protein [Wolbachia endosymbiont of Armadillidium vulgare]|uniref:Secretion system protein n=1 Tax=Wolbachia endosymbiont of Armadillidium arcangelii TaxID=3158571 RepID=A0AAU7Q1R4_9RICK|nr:secretion system protein [Wolbachia endosymbiont of Armadillidium vulgare]OJH31171.1 Type II secretion system protein D precursor [Wolbachia endosymbiont of Armadillidium vulgare]OJH32519.1 Type II secretion system protein D precursor [Wolbachia endosymbiont of Armadillidium vulgare]